jgi:hypothetical protein
MTIPVRGNGRDSQHEHAARRVPFAGAIVAKPRSTAPFDGQLPPPLLRQSDITYSVGNPKESPKVAQLES